MYFIVCVFSWYEEFLQSDQTSLRVNVEVLPGPATATDLIVRCIL